MPKRHARSVDLNQATAQDLEQSLFPNGSFLSTEERLKEAVDNEWLGLGDTTLIPTRNIFADPTPEEVENPALHLLGIMRQPEQFSFACKHVLNRIVSPMQVCVLWELWHKPFPMLLGTRGMSKSWTLAAYSMLRALFCQGSKIVIVGAAFRQSKVVFDYCESMWQSSPILRDMVGTGNGNGPRHEADRCSLRLGDSLITCLPMGTGEKIRGQRASIIIAEEFGSIPLDIFENVVSGFAAVSLSPIEKMQAAGRLRAMKRLGLAEIADAIPVVPGMNSNQTVISGTAYYRFNHFFQYWSRYKAIIESQGDQRKLEDIFGGEIPPNFNWRDYSIIRIPYDMIPEGFMDDKTIARAKVTYHKTQFLMEMGACAVPGTKVITPYGVSPIEDMKVGDLVLTHKGRFRPVTETFVRPYDGEVIEYKTLGCGEKVSMTPDHPYWAKGESWQSLDKLDGHTNLVCLQELSGLQHIDVRDYDDDYCEAANGTIYPRRSNHKLTRNQIREIKASSDTLESLGKRYSVTKQCIWVIKRRPKESKTAIKPIIPLNYEFGLIVGYYLAEGSTTKRVIQFALDGHVDTRLEKFVEELCNAISSVFGLKAKRYLHEDNVCCVVICQKLLASTFRSICPGTADTKRVEPTILFSTPEFMKGFLVGYWNGDGHRRCFPAAVGEAGSSNQGLLSQVRTVLSYFGIASSISAAKTNKTCPNNPSYVLALSGDNARCFFDFCYGQKLEGTKRSRIIVSDVAIRLPLVQKVRRNYSGPVYNLEVAEDHSYSLLNATVHNCWPIDSEGFFRRSLIETCVVGKPDNPISLPSDGPSPIDFSATLRGRQDKTYVFGVDPASESDNFSIVVLEVWPDHRRVVYCWTTTRKRHKARKAKGTAHEDDFYHYCMRKIRSLMGLFPCSRIALDKMGGGVAVLEALADPSRLLEGELPILPVIDPDDPQPSDRVPGEHILELVYFARADWVSSANHGLRFDLESKTLLFPSFDSASVGLALEEDRASGRVQDGPDGEEALYDTLEDCVLEIEELKEELASIVHTQVGTTGRDHWDTPESRTILGKKARTRKDRYSSLLMANAAARCIAAAPARPQYYATGGFAHDLAGGLSSPTTAARGHLNPPWYTQGGAGAVAKKR